METNRGHCATSQVVKLLIETPRQCNDQWCNELTFLLDLYICISPDKQVTSRKPKTSSQKHPNRSKVLQAGVGWLVHQRELQRQARSDTWHRKEVTLRPAAVKHGISMKVNMDNEWVMPSIKHGFCSKQCALLFKSNRCALSLCAEDISTF